MVVMVVFFMSTKSMELNDLNVNNVLDEIRPYIEADGGYLEYVAIDYLKEGPVVMVCLLYTSPSPRD